jgi:hypothetical protein
LITFIVYKSNAPKFINRISTPCQILIKEGYFNLSNMLNLKSLWMYHCENIQTRAYDICMGDMIWYEQVMETKMSKRVAELLYCLCIPEFHLPVACGWSFEVAAAIALCMGADSS